MGPESKSLQYFILLRAIKIVLTMHFNYHHSDISISDVIVSTERPTGIILSFI
jgi:hypothetical protein